ncbi:MAG: copper resistance protein B [Parvularculaceae bacterium]
MKLVLALALGFGTTAAALAQDPAATGSQAAAFYDREALATSRRALVKEHGGQSIYAFFGERLEYRSTEGSSSLLFDAQGWWGSDRNKLRIKSEVEYALDEDRFEEAELQALWSRAIGRYFDFQAGLRHDFSPDPSRTFGVIGVQGLAPYWFEIDANLFVSGDGDVSARLEAEYEMLLTQRLILQPRTELNFAVQSVESVGVGSGLSTAEIGARLRYEIRREFAPYAGLDWTRAIGKTADFARAAGDDPDALSLVAGIRFSF